MTDVDTSAEAVDLHLSQSEAEKTVGNPAYCDHAGVSTRVGWHRRNDALLRALAGERDALLGQIRDAEKAAGHNPASAHPLVVTIDRRAAENAKLRDLLKRADEELRLIRLKDTGALYDIGLRAALSAALAGDTRHD